MVQLKVIIPFDLHNKKDQKNKRFYQEICTERYEISYGVGGIARIEIQKQIDLIQVRIYHTTLYYDPRLTKRDLDSKRGLPPKLPLEREEQDQTLSYLITITALDKLGLNISLPDYYQLPQGRAPLPYQLYRICHICIFLICPFFGSAWALASSSSRASF
ncbi:hypothetical protein POM88_015043 [Heracleum sosnowskyi]|uniref:Uncharacterized protein n=1 Tax=Heracleum sosnowskyi TaxID=360622 RepID=A0AAD8MRK9_9APIA|nr:hypothetical protein POM88_015043 [Heracleum sosnowskyi]